MLPGRFFISRAPFSVSMAKCSSFSLKFIFMATSLASLIRSQKNSETSQRGIAEARLCNRRELIIIMSLMLENVMASLVACKFITSTVTKRSLQTVIDVVTEGWKPASRTKLPPRPEGRGFTLHQMTYSSEHSRLHSQEEVNNTKD